MVSASVLLDGILMLDGEFGAKVRASLDLLKNGFRVFGGENIIASYNGGKDALVSLYLLRAAEESQRRSEPTKPFSVVFFKGQDEFPEVLDFIEESMKKMGMSYFEFSGSWQSCLDSLRKSRRKNGLGDELPMCFVMGTRIRDPDCARRENFAPLKMSSKWTSIPFLRIQPIIYWSYHDTWRFVQEFNLPYCSLYDLGYTSIGSSTNSRPNPELKSDGGYRSAYELSDPSMERAGRIETISKSAEVGNCSRSLLRVGVLVWAGEEMLSDGFHALINSELRPLLAAMEKDGAISVARWVAVREDDPKTLAAEIRHLQATVNVALLFGLRGSKSDAILAHAVGEAFELPLQKVEEVGMLPSPHEAILVEAEEYPTIKVQNVVLFPGKTRSMVARLKVVLDSAPEVARQG